MAIGGYLARRYGGDPAGTDWRRLGRLAGFTNQKRERRLPNGYAPWVQLQDAERGWASQRDAQLALARQAGGWKDQLFKTAEDAINLDARDMAAEDTAALHESVRTASKTLQNLGLRLQARNR